MTGGRVVIIGSAGMLGRELVRACRRRGMRVRAFPGREALDLTDAGKVERTLTVLEPELVINAAGWTDVDGAESDPDGALRVNGVAVGEVARVCRGIGALLVHYSSDYVFDGRTDRPYHVDDAPGPLQAYGRSKLAGERAASESGCRLLLLRTSWLFAPHGRNFVRTVLELARERPAIDVVGDQHGRPTCAADLARMTLDLVELGARGTFHAANSGSCSWYEFAAAIVELAGCTCQVRACATGAYPRPAPRPAYSVLDLSGTVSLIGEPRHWRPALAECLGRITTSPVVPASP